jgi:hypothetical protein
MMESRAPGALGRPRTAPPRTPAAPGSDPGPSGTRRRSAPRSHAMTRRRRSADYDWSMQFFPASLLYDDVGVPVIVEVRLTKHEARGNGFTVDDRLPRPLQFVVHAGTTLLITIALAALLLAVLRGAWTGSSSVVFGLVWPIPLALAFSIFALIGVRSAWDVLRGHRRKRLCLGAGLCPGCLYSLKGVIDTPLVQCPECGATWLCA